MLRLKDSLEAEKRELQCLKEKLALKEKAVEESKALWEAERAALLSKTQKELHEAASKHATEREAQLKAPMDKAIVKYK